MFNWVSLLVNLRRPFEERRALALAMALLLGMTWTTSEAVPLGLYEVTTEMLMPHLEENVRYARTQAYRCIRDQAVSGFFPILRHQSLNGCKLAAGNRSGQITNYSLVCDSGQETTGTAQLNTVAGRIDGVLKIQMGGKNMTFSQRIEAKHQGDCQPPM
jgi:hypothetical protein